MPSGERAEKKPLQLLLGTSAAIWGGSKQCLGELTALCSGGGGGGVLSALCRANQHGKGLRQKRGYLPSPQAWGGSSSVEANWMAPMSGCDHFCCSHWTTTGEVRHFILCCCCSQGNPSAYLRHFTKISFSWGRTCSPEAKRRLALRGNFAQVRTPASTTGA